MDPRIWTSEVEGQDDLNTKILKWTVKPGDLTWFHINITTWGFTITNEGIHRQGHGWDAASTSNRKWNIDCQQWEINHQKKTTAETQHPFYLEQFLLVQCNKPNLEHQKLSIPKLFLHISSYFIIWGWVKTPGPRWICGSLLFNRVLNGGIEREVLNGGITGGIERRAFPKQTSHRLWRHSWATELESP